MTAAKRIHSKRWRWAVALTVAALVLGGGAAVWNFYLRSPAPRIDPASVEKFALPLPNKPSIAVLPFANVSGDKEQEYFADGMADDLITDLSKISGLFVIARNSSFTYKGRDVKVNQVAEELGVRYVLEGSVRRAGGKIRINAQLIDASTGHYVWADRFDRDYKGVFALQDEVIGRIVSALAVKLTDPELAQREVRKETEDLRAYDFLLRGNQFLSRLTAADTAKAREMFEKAIALDPNYARAYSLLGRLYYDEWRIWGESRDRNLARALALGKKALALDDRLAEAHLLLALVHQFRQQHEQAEAEANKTIALRPTNSATLAYLGNYLRAAGRAKEAIEPLQRAMRLDPFYPVTYHSWLGHAYFLTGRYEEAIRTLKKGVSRKPDYISFHVFLAMSYAMLGSKGEARAEATKVMKLNPHFSVRAYEVFAPRKTRDLERSLEALRRAGLPE